MRNRFLYQDLAIILFSVGIAVLLIKTGVLGTILTSTKELEILGSFVAGMFFTSAFTTAPAIAALSEIANANSVLLTAIFGALGAVLGDLIIFQFVRDRFSEHLLELFRHEGAGKRVRLLFKQRSFRWLTLFIGGLIIASPLPDEVGISILGFSKIRASWFIPISFFFNFIGILLIGIIAKAI